MPHHRREVGHGEQRRAVRVEPQEREDVVLRRIPRHPGEPGGIAVPLPERRRTPYWRLRSRTRSRTPRWSASAPYEGSRSHQSGPCASDHSAPCANSCPMKRSCLPGMRPHEAQIRPVRGALLPPVAGHLGHQRPLPVDDFVVGDRQDVVLAVRVHHGEGHLVVVVLAVDRLVRRRSRASRASSPCSTSARSRARRLSVGRVTPSQAVDSSAMVITPAPAGTPSRSSPGGSATASRFSRPP